MLGVMQSNRNIVFYILNNKHTDINRLDIYGINALCYACKFNNIDIISMISTDNRVIIDDFNIINHVQSILKQKSSVDNESEV